MASLQIYRVVAAILTAGIIAMGSGFIATILVQPTELEQNAYRIDTGIETVEAVEDEEEALPPVGPLLASADPAAGQGLSRACGTCHSFDQGGPNKVGPNLWNIVNRPVAATEGFRFSEALTGRGGEWTYEELNGFLAKPREWVPGTAMSYAGMRSPDDRANMVAWLRSLSDDPAPLPE